MFTARGYCSSFLRELEDDGAVVITDTDGNLKAQYKMVLSSGYIYRVYQYGFRGFYFA